MSPINYTNIPTPAKCYVDFCLIPVAYPCLPPHS
jgi:hypothetical protein